MAILSTRLDVVTPHRAKVAGHVPGTARSGLPDGGIAWSLAADALVTVQPSGVSWTVPGGVKALVWGGTSRELTKGTDWVLFCLQGNPQLYATPQENWAAVYGAQDVARIAWVNAHHDLGPRQPRGLVPCFSTAPVVQFLAGSDTTSGYVDGPASTALFNTPGAMDVGPDGTMYIVDGGNHAIRRYYPATQTVDTLLVDANLLGVSGPSVQAGVSIGGISVAATGDLYYRTSTGTVKKVPSGGSSGTVVASGLDGYGGCRLSPDNRTLYLPQPTLSTVLALDLATSVVSHYAGSGHFPDAGIAAAPGNVESNYYDATLNAARLTAMFPQPNDMTFDRAGNPHVFSSLFGSISRINPDGSVSRITRTGAYVSSGAHTFLPQNAYIDDSLSVSPPQTEGTGQYVSPLGYPSIGLFDVCGNLITPTSTWFVVRYITPDTILHTLAGAVRDDPLGSDYPSPYLTPGPPVGANSVRFGGITTGIVPRPSGGGCYALLAGSGPVGHNAHGLLLIG